MAATYRAPSSEIPCVNASPTYAAAADDLPFFLRAHVTPAIAAMLKRHAPTFGLPGDAYVPSFHGTAFDVLTPIQMRVVEGIVGEIPVRDIGIAMGVGRPTVLKELYAAYAQLGIDRKNYAHPNAMIKDVRSLYAAYRKAGGTNNSDAYVHPHRSLSGPPRKVRNAAAL